MIGRTFLEEALAKPYESDMMDGVRAVTFDSTGQRSRRDTTESGSTTSPEVPSEREISCLEGERFSSFGARCCELRSHSFMDVVDLKHSSI